VRIVRLALSLVLVAEPFALAECPTEADLQCRRLQTCHGHRCVERYGHAGHEHLERGAGGRGLPLWKLRRHDIRRGFCPDLPGLHHSSGDLPEQIAAAINSGAGVANAKAVSGIGDKAVEYSLTSPGASGIVIFAFKSNVLVMIAVTPAIDPAKIEQLARTAIGKL
jgi:hypothetical protein